MTTKKKTLPDNNEIYTFLDTIYTWWSEKTLVAVSWGADSIYVSILMQGYRKSKNRDKSDLLYIYCDHGIRKDNKDLHYIQKYIDTKQLHIAARTDTKNNTEASLRKRRYTQIKKYMQKIQSTKLITGHHLSDRIESTFLNLLRGCDMDGFVSMQRVDHSHLIHWDIIRPLLTMSKSHIQHMCDTNHIDYSYDHTNEDISISKRNKVRNTILSELRALANKNTATHNTFEQSMRHIYESLEHAAQENAELNIEMIPMYKHRQTKRAYRRNIQPKDISTDQLKRLCKQLHIQQNIQKKNIKEIAEFLQTKNKWHKYINHSYFFISQWNIYIIYGPKRFWELTTQDHPKNSEDLFDQIIAKKASDNRRFGSHNDKIHGKSIKKRCTNQKIPIFRRHNIIGDIQKNGEIKPIIRDFMISKKPD